MHRIQINRIMHIKRMHRIQMHIYNCIYRNAMNTNKTQQMHRIRCIQYNEYSTMHIIHSILCGKISQIPIAATSRSCDFLLICTKLIFDSLMSAIHIYVGKEFLL